MNCETCQNHEALERQIKSMERDIQTLFTRTELANERQIRTETKLDAVLEQIKKLSQKIDELSSAPKNRWDTIVTSAITAIVGSLVTGGIAAMILIK